MMRPAPWATFATCSLSLFLVTLDVTAVNVALPDISRDLDTSISGLQWTIDAYTVVIASFLMLAGATADRVGRRRVFRTGLAVFTTGSLLCSLSPNVGALVGFRIVQALGGAMLNPVAMSIIVNTFTDATVRARAIGIWGAVFGVSMALGPILGGTLVEAIGWRSIFWINVPVGITAFALTFRYVPESRGERARRVDAIGQFLVVFALGALTFALIEGHHAGWLSPPIVGGFAVAAIALGALIAYERRRVDPLIDLRFFRSLPFASATILAVVAFTTFNGGLFLSSLYLQQTRGLSPADAGACLLPVAIALVICSPLSGRLVGAGRARWAIVAAGAATAISASLLVDLSTASPFAVVIVAFGVFGIGLGLINTPITNAAVSGMPRAQAGVASALASTSRQVGASLGVAIAGTLAARDGHDPAFAASTHPFWWLFVASGLAIVAIGIAATGDHARRTVERVASLVDV